MVKSKTILLIIIIFLFINSFIFITALPTYFDWRNKDGQDWMTSVKDQGYCGSCWAHSAVGVVEAQYNIAKNQSDYDLNLSEERYNQLFKLETSIQPKEIRRIGVVYSPIEESISMGATASTTGTSAIIEENCADYNNQIKIYCNPFLSTYNKDLCNKSEENYKNNNCCQSKTS